MVSFIKKKRFQIPALLQQINPALLTAIILAAILVGLTLRLLFAPPLYRVALVMPADPHRPGWSSFVLASAGPIERTLETEGFRARIDYTTALTEPEQALALFANRGYDLVIAADDSYEEAAHKTAARFPATRFALLSNTATGNDSNLGVIALRHAELGQMAGRVMAAKTETGRVAYLADGQNPRRSEALRGLRRTTGDNDLIVHWHTGSPEEAARLAARLFDQQQVDVICIDADIDIVIAVYEQARRRPGKYVSNWHIDLSPLYPDHTLGSYNADLASILPRAAVWASRGEWPGRRSFGIKENAFNMTPLHNLERAEHDQIWAAWGGQYDKEFEQ